MASASPASSPGAFRRGATTAPHAGQEMANAIRALAMDAVEKAQSGHPGMPMGMADVATALFTKALKYDPRHPEWPDRDRFVLSAGHGSMLLYAVLYLTGYKGLTLDDLRNFRQWGAKTAGHPEYGHAPGIETTTGPLGQGLANAVGMAMAERALNAAFGDDLVDHYTYALVGDGCLMEGISQEAITLAGHLKLRKLIVLFDDNGISIDGPTDLTTSEDTLQRFTAAGWATAMVDGHDGEAVLGAIDTAKKLDRPTLIACRTVIGFGAPKKQGTAATHGSPLGAEEIAAARKSLGWASGPFDIPAPILDAWRRAGTRGALDFDTWTKRLEDADPDVRAVFERRMSGTLPDGFATAVAAWKSTRAADAPKWATRKASGEFLSAIAAHMPELLGGSADLTGSNLTLAKDQGIFSASNYRGGYVHYGVREHGMAAAMNGIALHGGVVPYGGTFLVFADYCRPSIRLAALMGVRVIFVMTHDSIGLGEDGPTHQPIEHLASLRAIPNLLVFRPGDAVEVAECWALALADRARPSVIALSRQATPAFRTRDTQENLSARGGYVVAEASLSRRATILATGTEVAVALDARTRLEADGIPTAVVSLPSWELFAEQNETYRHEVLGPRGERVAVEAASTFGWTRFVESEDDVIGMRRFGASAPAEELYRQFGITADEVVARVRKKLGAA